MGFEVASLFDAVGLVGVAFYVCSYAALQLGFLRGQGYAYPVLNALAAGCVLISLLEQFNLSSAFIQIFWIAISAVGIARLIWRSYRVRFTEDEKDFLKTKLPTLSKDLSRRMLDSGFWVDAEPGTVLTTEGVPVTELVYIRSGNASVSLGGHTIGRCGDHTFVGEITCLKNDKAIATVIIDEPSRYFCIGAEALRTLAEKSTELKQALEASFASDTGRKLVASNELLRSVSARAAD
ncbi:MAG: cyclic nucleotide-binding domain-containing protein [Alphaproteobacteria bacterium]